MSERRPVRQSTPARAPSPLPASGHELGPRLGGFTEIKDYGSWDALPPPRYAELVRRYSEEIGNLAFAAPQDWMCEELMLAKTGLSVAEHQRRTVDNFIELRSLLGPLVVPALQGYTLDDYLRCVDLYAERDVDLTVEPLVGLGSVCRRQATAEIGEIVARLHGLGLRLHGFGCKSGALRRYGPLLASADSMAWSYGGRRRGTCETGCQNHLHWALDWRTDVMR